MIHWQTLFIFPFAVTAVAWGVWLLGWKGATKRNPCALMGYFVFTLIGAIFQVLGFFFTSVGGSLITVLVLNKCAQDAECPDTMESRRLLPEYPWIITVIFVFSIVVYIIPLFLNVIGLFLSMAIRKELLAIRRVQQQHLALQEEGCCNSVKADSVPVQEQQAQVAAPIFYAQQGQGYMPLTAQQGNGIPTIIYVPYPAEQQEYTQQEYTQQEYTQQ